MTIDGEEKLRDLMIDGSLMKIQIGQSIDQSQLPLLVLDPRQWDPTLPPGLLRRLVWLADRRRRRGLGGSSIGSREEEEFVDDHLDRAAQESGRQSTTKDHTPATQAAVQTSADEGGRETGGEQAVEMAGRATMADRRWRRAEEGGEEELTRGQEQGPESGQLEAHGDRGPSDRSVVSDGDQRTEGESEETRSDPTEDDLDRF